MREISESAWRVTCVDIPTEVGHRRAGDPPILLADPCKVYDDLGWRPESIEVETTIENFSHRDSQIKVEETLVWTNMDAVPHTVTLGSGGVAEPGFDSSLIGPGQSFALKFDRPGTYSYTCTLHPNMNGEIVVTQ